MVGDPCGFIFAFDAAPAPALSTGTVGVDGILPLGAPVENWEGRIYGTTFRGGERNLGTIYSHDPASGSYRVVYSIGTGAGVANNPVAGLVEERNHVLYGTTPFSTSGEGTVFRIIVDGGRNDYRELHVFGSGTDGRRPLGGLVEDRAGWLYGTTREGGQFGHGTLFRIQANDTGTYEVLHHFQGPAIDGTGPASAVTPVWSYDTLGYVIGLEFYGTTATSVFRFRTNGNQFSTIVSPTPVSLSGSTLLAANNGNLYAISAPENGVSAICRIKLDGSPFAILHTFVNAPLDLPEISGWSPSSVVDTTDPARGFRLHGTARVGGSSGQGVIWEWFSGRGWTTPEFWTFAGSDPADGRRPSGAIAVLSDGVWGVAESGGTGRSGTLFRFVPTYTGQLVNFNRYRGHLHDFGQHANRQVQPLSITAGRDNLLYGCTAHDGIGGGGTVFKMTTDGTSRLILREFGATGGDGLHPVGAPIEGTDGMLYGCTMDGGSRGFGRVYRMNKDGSGYQPLHDFLDQNWPGTPDGSHPVASLVEGPDGRLYGSTQNGGRDTANIPTDMGTLFRINKDGTGYEVLHSLNEQADLGGNPVHALTVGPDGALYGTTPITPGLRSEVFWSACLFRQGLDGAFSRLSTPFGVVPINPQGPLLLANDGLLYGTSLEGGAFGMGSVFAIDPVRKRTTIIHSFTLVEGDGIRPRGPLLEGRNGMLCGVTDMGGAYDQGTLYVVNKDGSDYRVIKSFGPDSPSSGAGVYPYSVTQTTDGTIFVSTYGGPNNAEASLWRYSPVNQSPRLVATPPSVSAVQYAAFAVALPQRFTDRRRHSDRGWCPGPVIDSNLAGNRADSHGYSCSSWHLSRSHRGDGQWLGATFSGHGVRNDCRVGTAAIAIGQAVFQSGITPAAPGSHIR